MVALRQKYATVPNLAGPEHALPPVDINFLNIKDVEVSSIYSHKLLSHVNIKTVMCTFHFCSSFICFENSVGIMNTYILKSFRTNFHFCVLFILMYRTFIV